MTAVRVVSWNLGNRVGDAARREGDFLRSLDPGPDIVMLQEVNRRSTDLVCERAGLDWIKLAVDIRERQIDDTAVRQRGVALAGRGLAPTGLGIIEDAPLPERTIFGSASVAGINMTIASYWAPPGVNWFEKKPQQAVMFAKWLADRTGPIIFGADANTPLVDHPSFEKLRTHWHSGDRHLHGKPGDDLLWGPAKLHTLRDALRRWFEEHPEELDEIRRLRPNGPLAVSHRTGKRRLSAGTDRRFDSVWVTDHFTVDAVAYPYEGSIKAGSDHAAVIVDLHTGDTSEAARSSSTSSERSPVVPTERLRVVSMPGETKSRPGSQTEVQNGSAGAAAFFDGIERQQAKISIPVATLNAHGLSQADIDTVTDPGFRGGTVSVRLGAAGCRYLGDTCGIGPVPSEWPEELPEVVADMIAGAIPFAAEWIRFDPDNEKRVVFSGDLARGRGDDPVAVAKKYKATAKNSRLTAPPGR